VTTYLLDTNVLSRLARGGDAGLARTVAARVMECRLSAIVWFELQYGAARSPSPAKALPRLALLRTLFPAVEAFDEEAARRAGEVRVFLEGLRPNAQPIGHYDVLLAGHALALGSTLVTHNTREFARVPGLTLEDWQSS
jgi:tRNA(fMet)-specific endonuclease VapC